MTISRRRGFFKRAKLFRRVAARDAAAKANKPGNYEKGAYIMGLIEKIFGNYSQKELKRIDPTVKKVLAL